MILRRLPFLLLSFVYLLTFGSCTDESELAFNDIEMPAGLTLDSCAEESPEPVQNNVNSHSSEVVIKWLDMQLNMLRIPLAEGTGSQASGRAQAYCGIALYESLVQSMPSHESMQGQLTDFPQCLS